MTGQSRLRVQQSSKRVPPAPTFVADPAAYAAWRSLSLFPNSDSLFEPAASLGLTTGLFGTTDFHMLHINLATIEIIGLPEMGADLAHDITTVAAMYPKLLGVVAVGGPRTADRHDPKAVAELAALANQVAELAGLVPNALVVITSRGATEINDPGADFYGPGSSRHVPLIVLGPGVRAGVVTGQPAAPADVPATILYALGAPTTTDAALGTWASGTPVQGVPQPLPAAATEGHVLLRAFAAAAP